jgi:ATP-dependent Lon protease
MRAELGLFPLETVLLPSERVPLHIFEVRYQELIGECLEEESEFGFLFEDDEGTREIGTRAKVVEVLERFDDGRLNIVVEGGERFLVLRETEGRSFRTAEVEAVVDGHAEADRSLRDRALELYRGLRQIAEVEIDEPSPGATTLSFELAARVDFGAQRKQDLLELRSERERLQVLTSLLERASEAITLERAVAEAAAKNGRRLPGSSSSS